MAVSDVVPFVAVSVVIVAVPGPSVLFAVSRTIVGGRRFGLLTVLGNAIGLLAQVLLIATGLGIVLTHSPEAHSLLTVAGAAYLVWLGIGTIRRGRALRDTPTPPADGTGVAVRDGFLVGLGNAKSLLFLAALLPQYIRPDGADAGVHLVVLGLVFCAVALTLDSVWVMAAATVRGWLMEGDRLRWATMAGGAVIVALGGRLLVGH